MTAQFIDDWWLTGLTLRSCILCLSCASSSILSMHVFHMSLYIHVTKTCMPVFTCCSWSFHFVHNGIGYGVSSILHFMFRSVECFFFVQISNVGLSSRVSCKYSNSCVIFSYINTAALLKMPPKNALVEEVHFYGLHLDYHCATNTFLWCYLEHLYAMNIQKQNKRKCNGES